MKKVSCVVAVCGVLGCVHNECGRCYNEVTALGKDGACLCFEQKREPAPCTEPVRGKLVETNHVENFDVLEGLSFD